MGPRFLLFPPHPPSGKGARGLISVLSGWCWGLDEVPQPRLLLHLAALNAALVLAPRVVSSALNGCCVTR